jgi:hypothetical protein
MVFEDGDIKPIVDLIYSFDDGIDAYEYLEATGRAQRKVIMFIPTVQSSSLHLQYLLQIKINV